MDSFTGTDGSTINAGGEKSSLGSCKNFAGYRTVFSLYFLKTFFSQMSPTGLHVL